MLFSLPLKIRLRAYARFTVLSPGSRFVGLSSSSVFSGSHTTVEGLGSGVGTWVLAALCMLRVLRVIWV